MAKLKGGSGLPRKEQRKAHKLAAKEKRQQRHASRAAVALQTSAAGTKVKSALSAADGGGNRGGKSDPPSGNRKRQQDGNKKGGGGGGGSGSGTRHKRWTPEELDPMIAAEDAEIKRLERLLGVSGTAAKKKRAKLDREIEVEDGMGDEFGAFLSGLDRISKVVDGGAANSSSDGMDADWDFHENVPEGDSDSDGGGGGGADADGGHRNDDEEEDDYFTLQGGGGRELLEGVLGSDDDVMFSEEELQEGEDEHEDVVDGGGSRAGVGMRRDSVRTKKEDEEEEEEEEEGEEEDSDEDEDEDEGQSEEQDHASTRDTADDSDSPAAGEEESEDHKMHSYRPKPGQDIYGRTVGAGNDGAAPAKYVPPHLRAAAAAAAAAATKGGAEGDGDRKRAEVQRVINGIMNRLSEETLEPVTARLREVYRAHSTTEANEALWQATRAVCVHDKHVMTTLIPSFAAVIAALNISLGADVGGFFLEIIARELNAEVWGPSTSGVPVGRGSAGSGSSGRGRGRGRGTGSNLILLLAQLYNYGVAHCTLIYDIIGRLVDGFGAAEMELLLLLLRHSGFQLRSDDSQALKQIVALVKEKSAAALSACSSASPDENATADTTTTTTTTSTIAEETDRWKAKFGTGASSTSLTTNNPDDNDASGGGAGGSTTAQGGSRARYILDTILELQSSKRSRLQEQGQESGRRVRKWLGSVKAAKGGGGGTSGDASLRVTWAELVSTESRGRWWRVGAAWVGRGASLPSAAPGKGVAQEQDGTDAAHVETGSSVGRGAGDGAGRSENGTGGAGGRRDDGEVGLLALAARQRMNNDVRRSVFVAIMGSSDCEDALEKILRLNLKGAQEREIARVIVECCSQEGSYNPFYAHLAERACDRQPKLRFTFQVAFWDALKALDDSAARRAGSLARLMAHLVVRKQLSLTVLKTVDIPELSPNGLSLLRVFFHEIIAAGDDASFMQVFRRLARPPGGKEGGGHSAARDNTLVFLRGHLGPAPSGWDRDRRKAFRKRVKGACRLIEAIVTSEELG